MIQTVQKILAKYIEVNDRVILAVSGGPDSMCLLDLCRRILKPEQIVVAHFDHHVREDSGRDAAIVRDYCAKHGLVFELSEADILDEAENQKRTVEEMGRILRYAFFRELREKYGAKYIVVAHHGDDQIETILMHFVRGTNLHGLSGMSEMEGDILRPLLSCTKKELLEYIDQERIEYAVDSTNLEATASRNILRLKVIPELLKINPGLSQTLQRSGELFRTVEEDLGAMAGEYLQIQEKGTFDQTAFCGFPVSVQREVLKLLYVQHYGSTEGLYSAELEEVRRFFLTSVTGKEKEFGKKILLKNSKKVIILK